MARSKWSARSFVLVCLFGGALLVPSSGLGQGATANAVFSKNMKTVSPNATSARILREIRHYQRWPEFPENEKPKFSQAHTGLYVVTYHNAKVTQAMKRHTLPLPNGSIIVKENRPQPTAKPVVLTVMAKRNGRWYWLDVTPSGEVAEIDGKALQGTHVPSCQTCHARRSSNDDVFTHDFSK